MLTCAPIPESRTAGRLAGAFDAGRLAGIEMALAAVYRRWLALVPAEVRAGLVLRDPTIDLDASDIEVFGPSKEGMGWNYTGLRCGRVHLASWAQAELPLAADLIAGNDDPRPEAPDLLRRALAALPPQVCGRPRVRADAGYFDGALAHAALEAGCDFAIAAKRNPAAWRALAAISEDQWSPARGMPGAQVAACDYEPAAAAPFRKSSWRWPSAGSSTTSGRSASSSPTSPPTTATTSGCRRGSGGGPASKTGSAKVSTARA